MQDALDTQGNIQTQNTNKLQMTDKSQLIATEL